MAKESIPTSDSAWWLGPPPREGWTQRCLNQFDVRLSCRLITGGSRRNNSENAFKLATFRSRSTSAAQAGVRRQGFLISERSPRGR